MSSKQPQHALARVVCLSGAATERGRDFYHMVKCRRRAPRACQDTQGRIEPCPIAPRAGLILFGRLGERAARIGTEVLGVWRDHGKLPQDEPS